MSPSAIFPSHYLLARAATAAAAQTPDPAPALPIRKYIVLSPEAVGQPERVILFDPSIAHCRALPPGETPVSAGFVVFCRGAPRVPEIGSETLGLQPRPQDLALIAHFLQST